MSTYIGTPLDDEFWCGEGDDFAAGEAGNDDLDGWMGHDTIFGGTGDDTLRGGYTNPGKSVGHDVIYGQLGNDQLYGDDGNDFLSGGYGNDIMYGDESYTTPGDDILVGGRGNDLIFAGAGNDTVMAGKGEDTLRGGEGRDLLVGIADGMVDAFVFNVLADSGVGKARDRIVGFETGLDVIDLHFIDADTSRSGDQKFQFSDVGPVENGLWFTQKAIGIIVHADVDGDSVADFELRLTGLSSISAQDFIL